MLDNNIRGILAVTGSAAAIFWPGALTFGFSGVMSPFWEEMFNTGSGATGNTLFFLLFGVGIFMFFVGKWQERVGTRIMITLGALICGLSLIIVANAVNIYMVYIWAFLNGMGVSFIYVPGLTTVQRWFPQKRGLVSGIVNLMFGFSAATMVPLFSVLLETQGYMSMIYITAAFTLIISLISAQFTEVPERVKKVSKYQVIQNNFNLQNADVNNSLTVAESVRTRSFWFLWLIWALQGAAGIAMVTNSVNFGLTRGMPMESAVLILTTFNVTNGLSRIITGYLSDIIGRNLTMSIAFFAAGGAYFILAYTYNLAAAAVLAAVVGFAFGTLFAVSAPLISDCFGLKHFGAILGLQFTAFGFVAGLLGPSLSGYLLDTTGGNFIAIFSYLGIFCLLSGILVKYVVPPQLKEEKVAQSMGNLAGEN